MPLSKGEGEMAVAQTQTHPGGQTQASGRQEACCQSRHSAHRPCLALFEGEVALESIPSAWKLCCHMCKATPEWLKCILARWDGLKKFCDCFCLFCLSPSSDMWHKQLRTQHLNLWISYNVKNYTRMWSMSTKGGQETKYSTLWTASNVKTCKG